MSKSIYEEALDKTNEFFESVPNEIIKTHMFMKFPLTQITKALEQAQKQEKLLELYKELSNYVDEQTYAHELSEITLLKILIKELEK